MPAPPPAHAVPRRQRRRRRAALLTLAALLPAVLLTTAPAATADPNLVTNPGFETAGTGDMPHCWSRSGWGGNEFVIQPTADARTGSVAMEVTLTERTDGDRKALITESAACAPYVEEGHQYDLSLWYKATTGSNSVTVFRHDTTLGWQYWTDLQTLGPAAAYTRTEVRTPEIPPGTDRIAWGVSLYAVGTLITDDYAMVDATAPDPGPVCTGTRAECEDGRWDVLPVQNPVRSMHSVVLHNGKVLLIAGSGNSEELFAAGTFTSAVYDPADGSYTVIPTPDDMFCAGHVQLADGRVLVMSGNLAYPDAGGTHGYEGYKDSYIFDPATETYTRTNDMNDGHWYPSATILGNGDVISFGGLREDSTGSVTAELWSHEQQQWLPSWQVNQTWSFWGLYPSMILMQDGRLFYSGSHVFGNGTPGTGASIYDYDANTITDVPGLQNKDERDQSASVLLPPAQDQRVITMGGGNIDTNPDGNRLTDIIDLTEPDPQYEPGPLLPQGTVDLGAGPVPQTGDQGKMYVSAVLLPDSTVLETGGALHNRADPVYESSVFDPVTGTFDPVAPNPEAYGYHSSAFLLPDGRVMATGDNPGDGSWNHNVSVYTPPYLFRGDRPEITSVASTEWEYGSTQQITVDSPIVRAELIRPAAVTHSSDPNQRFVDLPLTVDGDTVGLNVTSNPNLAPPGWYMLFAVNADGVPSVAEWVHLGVPESGAALAATTTGGHQHHGAMALSGGGEPLSGLSSDSAAAEGAAEREGEAEGDVPAVQDFANGLTGEVRGPGKKRESEPVDVRIAGCERAYGAAGVCVPAAFPQTVADTTRARCEWLRQHGFGRLELNGTEDPLLLDPGGDGIACGKGDVPRRHRLT
ncbi:galactose oxidase-like domain-containing protein [Streptomyces sp. YIM 98790]|uniref:galactose oxidase-like domain-containing protein n=1 Tax=Streptomyces sp. YIM 98790 TaxID=2689077 RepID=UPI001A9DCC54